MKKFLKAMAAIAAIAVAFLWFGWKFGSSDTTEVTVCTRVMEVTSPNEVEYSIITDSSNYVLDRTKFNRVLNSHTYTITYSGWKLPIFGVYPEVEEITPVVPADKDGIEECDSRRPKE